MSVVLVGAASLPAASIDADVLGAAASARASLAQLDRVGVSSESLEVEFGVVMTASQQVALVAELSPVFDERQRQLVALGRRRQGLVPLQLDACVGLRNFPRPWRERLARPGKRTEVIDDLFPLKHKRLELVEKLIGWSTAAALPKGVRAAAAEAVSSIDSDILAGRPSKVDGHFKRVKQLVVESIITASDSASRGGGEAQVTAFVNLVTGVDIRLSRWLDEGLLDALRAEPGGAATLAGAVNSAERVVAQLRVLQTELAQ